MSLRYMLDTNLCIRVLRDRPAHIRRRFNDESDALAISTIVLTELLHGAVKSARRQSPRRRDFASRVHIASFDGNAARHSAEIKADLERRGGMIGSYDLLIAGHARSLDLILITSSLGEFTRVDQLKSEDWL